jgi:hypothetical protein
MTRGGFSYRSTRCARPAIILIAGAAPALAQIIVSMTARGRTPAFEIHLNGWEAVAPLARREA